MADIYLTRRNKIRARLNELGADAFYFSSTVGGNDSFISPSVRYLSGFSGSNAQLIIGTEGDAFFTDPRYDEQSAKECRGLDRFVYGIRPSGGGDAKTAFGLLKDQLSEVIAGGRSKSLCVDAATTTLSSAQTLQEQLEVSLVETKDVVEDARLIKDSTEIEALRTANSYGDSALAAVLPQLLAGMSEFEVAVLLEHEMRKAGSEGTSFPTIVAFGEQAAEPHHQPTKRELKQGDLIKFDFGGTHRGYKADMTRTVAFGDPKPEHRKIYELVRGAQEAGLAAVKAGTTNGAVDAAARDYLIERGYDFGHGTGHGVGLEVHEAPGVTKAGEVTLVAGMCITVEPGIYIPGECGVRIEDSVAVTENGCDVLTTTTKELQVV